MEIPFTVERRADTGLYNAQLGLWLFLASEVMLFGGLFSAYALLRTGAAAWPHGWTRLNTGLGGVNTILLLASSVTVGRALAVLRAADERRGRRLLASAAGLGTLFLLLKALEYREHLALRELPATDTFFALYYTLTGVHALHLIGGILIVAYLAGPGASLFRTAPERFVNRVASAALYWHFVDAVWIVVFALMYLS